MLFRSTVIDLDELDNMIRSQTGANPTNPRLQQFDPRGYSRISAKPRGRIHPPEYEYLATLSGHTGEQPNVTGYGSLQHETNADATKYYLTLASQARRNGHWASVESYYRMAWRSLPENRKQAALVALEQAREKASQERIIFKDQAKTKPGK